MHKRTEPEASTHSGRMSQNWITRPAGLALFICVLLLAILTIGPGRSKAQEPRAAQPTPLAVAAEAASVADVDVTLSGLGTVTPMQTVTVRSQINGQLLRVAFQEGQSVRAGDLLAEVDARPFQVQLLQYEGQLQRDEALLGNAKVDLRRYQRLLKEDSIAEQEVVTQKALVQQYAGAIAIDRGQIASAKLQMQYARITSPVTGRVGLRLVDVGNFVQTSDTNGLVVITQLQPIAVVFTLPEDSLPEVMKHYRAGEHLSIDAYNRAGQTRLAQGILLAVDNQIDPTTGTVKLKARFENADAALFPNQFVNVKLIVETLHGVTTVPSAAIQRGTPGTFVYAVQDDQTVDARVVQLGPTSGDRVVLLQGLAPNERVVVDGADKLRDGMKVDVVTHGPQTVPGPTVSQNSNADR
jgi:membrane fusion protein, multidrug efflux system